MYSHGQIPFRAFFFETSVPDMTFTRHCTVLTYIYIDTHSHIYSYMCVCLCVFECVCLCMSVYICVRVYGVHNFTCIHAAHNKSSEKVFMRIFTQIRQPFLQLLRHVSFSPALPRHQIDSRRSGAETLKSSSAPPAEELSSSPQSQDGYKTSLNFLRGGTFLGLPVAPRGKCFPPESSRRFALPLPPHALPHIASSKNLP